jgi:hypothetical protein
LQESLAKAEADICVPLQPTKQWTTYEPAKRKEIADKINASLTAEGSPAVEDSIVWWKMEMVVRGKVRAIALRNASKC